MLKTKDTELLLCTYDCMFKSVMLDPDNVDYLVGYINMITKLPIDIIKKNIKIENIEHTIENKKDKKLKSDIIVSIGKLYINIEMNKDYYDGLFLKNSAYTHKISSSMYNVGDDFSSEFRIYQINFDNFTRFNGKKEIYKFIMKEEDTNEILDESYINYHVDLEYIYNTCYNKSVNKLSKFERYCLMLMADTKEFASKVSGDDKVMNKVRDKIEVLSEDEKMIGLYDAEKIAEKVKNTQIKSARNEGIKEGIEKGIKQGIEKGIEQEKINIVTNMLNKSLDINLISEVTGLSIEQIKNLNN